jgi:hypothetical protein
MATLEITRAITTQVNILLNGLYIVVGLVVIVAIAVFGSIYLYGEYQEFKRSKQTKDPYE